MHIEDAVLAYLKSYAGLTALVGSRIYPEEVPETEKLPAVTYILVSSEFVHTLDGKATLERPVYQYTAYADTKAAARAVAAQISLALSDYHGTLSGVVVQKIELQNEMSTLISSGDGTVKTYTHDLEFEITYERT